MLSFYHQHNTLFLESEVIILRNHSHPFAVVVDSVSHNKWIPMVVASVAGVCWVVVAVLTYKTSERLAN